MERNTTVIFALSLSVLMLAGCDPNKDTTIGKMDADQAVVQNSYDDILKEDQAKLVISLNKGYKNTVISTNKETKSIDRIQPCLIEPDEKLQSTGLELCKGDTYPDPTKVRYKTSYELIVYEGSVCITIISGSMKYQFCDPPYDLGFCTGPGPGDRPVA